MVEYMASIGTTRLTIPPEFHDHAPYDPEENDEDSNFGI